MKHLILFSMSVFYFLFGKAQQPEPLLLALDYSFTHVHDTSNRDHPLQENMTLYVAANSSSYRHSQAIAVMPPAGGDAGAKPVVVNVVHGMPMAVVYAPGYTDVELLQYPATRKLVTCAKVGMSTFVVDQALPVINWQIGQQTKMIGEYKCQQATGAFGGRTYTAWFTTELPFHYGPWKLSGLPGLILEAYDSTGDIRFAFRSLLKGQPDQLHRWGSEKLITTSMEALIKAKNAFEEDPVGTMQAQLPPGAPAPGLSYRDINDRFTMGAEAQLLVDKKRKTAKTFVNNPIEYK